MSQSSCTGCLSLITRLPYTMPLWTLPTINLTCHPTKLCLDTKWNGIGKRGSHHLQPPQQRMWRCFNRSTLNVFYDIVDYDGIQQLLGWRGGMNRRWHVEHDWLLCWFWCKETGNLLLVIWWRSVCFFKLFQMCFAIDMSFPVELTATNIFIADVAASRGLDFI